MPINPDDYVGQPYDQIIRDLIVMVNEHEQILTMDAELRARNPSLQDAYEHYLTIKNLAK